MGDVASRHAHTSELPALPEPWCSSLLPLPTNQRHASQENAQSRSVTAALVCGGFARAWCRCRRSWACARVKGVLPLCMLVRCAPHRCQSALARGHTHHIATVCGLVSVAGLVRPRPIRRCMRTRRCVWQTNGPACFDVSPGQSIRERTFRGCPGACGRVCDMALLSVARSDARARTVYVAF